MNGEIMEERQLLPPLSTEEFEDLRADIEAHGVLVPIVVSSAGVILDGHHRKRIADELRIDCPVQTIDLDGDEVRESAFALRANLNRRNLTREQRREVQQVQKQLAVELNAAGWTQEQIGAELGVSREAVSKWFATNGNNTEGSKPRDLRVKITADDKEAAFEMVAAGATHEQVAADLGVSRQAITKVVADVRERKEERQRKVEATATFTPGIINAAVSDLPSEIKHGSIDAIITDPPYPREFLHTFSDLSLAASKLLKPGGICVVMSGQLYLPDVYARLTEHLDYYWTAAYHTAGQSANIRHRNVTVTWKPLIILTNGPAPDLKWFTDRTVSEKNDKDHHDWGQSVSGITSLVEQFTEPGDLILDPFLGAGTTVLAAKRLGRRYIGADIDADQCRITSTRLKEDG